MGIEGLQKFALLIIFILGFIAGVIFGGIWGWTSHLFAQLHVPAGNSIKVTAQTQTFPIKAETGQSP